MQNTVIGDDSARLDSLDAGGDHVDVAGSNGSKPAPSGPRLGCSRGWRMAVTVPLAIVATG
jgi:hypothetical protein